MWKRWIDLRTLLRAADFAAKRFIPVMGWPKPLYLYQAVGKWRVRSSAQ